MNEIIPRLFIGDVYDCTSHPEIPNYLYLTWEAFCGRPGRISLLDEEHWKKTGKWLVHTETLDIVSDYINSCYLKGTPTLVHCNEGRDRARLAVAWFMRKTGLSKTLEDAYAVIIGERPIARNRTDLIG